MMRIISQLLLLPLALLLLQLLQTVVNAEHHMVVDFQDRKDDAMVESDQGINGRMLHPNGIVTMPMGSNSGWVTHENETHLVQSMSCKRLKTNDDVDPTDDEYGLKYWQLTQCPVDVTYDFRIVWVDVIAKGNDRSIGRADLFPYWSPKRYKVTMRMRTTMPTSEPFEDVVMEIRPTSYRANHVLFRGNISITPEMTDGQWHLTQPLELPVDIGGNDDLTVRVIFPTAAMMQNQPPHCNFQFRDFDFVPPGAFSTDEHSVNWFIEWKDRVIASVKAKYQIPDLPLEDFGAFNASAEKLQTLVWDEDRAKGAEQDAYRIPIHEEYQTLLSTATPLLERVLDPFLTNPLDTAMQDPEWFQAILLTHGSPLKFADYCTDHGPQACSNLIQFMREDTELMHEFLKYGGARAGFYGQALDLYRNLQREMMKGYPVLEKLAMAVALELSEPALHHRWQSEFELNPIERYKHYEEAYLGGELDPYFETFSVWEMRWAICDDAPDSQLKWAREMLRTFRPDIVVAEDQGFRYGGIQRTDVKYTQPKWTSLPEGDHAQTLSIGGLCGPRAKFSRLINRAFGIPVWGVTVPGHATIFRWKPDEWHNPLGRRWWHGWWDGRDGFDFYMETEIRHELGDDVYFRDVDSMMWVAQMIGGEWQRGSLPEVDNPWTGLSLMQRRRVRNRFTVPTPTELPATSHIDTLVADMLEQPLIDYEPMVWTEEGRYKYLKIPAMSWTANNGGIDTMKSFDGGMQLLFNEGGEVIYDVNMTSFGLAAGKYKFAMMISSVHSEDPVPFKLAVSSSVPGVEAAVYDINIPYTFGRWEYTKAIQVDLGGGMETLELSRDGECRSVSIKQFSLTPA